MVYINLSVNDLQRSVEFYSSSIGFFDSLHGDRLTCNVCPELTLDLIQVGTDRHRKRFGLSHFCPSSFSLHIETQDDSSVARKLEIISRLQRQDIPYQLVENLGGSFISIIDPSGNRLGVHTHCGDLI